MRKIVLDEPSICKDYETMSAYKIANKHGVSDVVIYGVLKRNGVVRRTLSEAKKMNFSFNENFFDEINNEEKAYWLGFVAADGSLSSSPPKLRFGLAEKDRSSVEMFRDSVGSNHRIHDTQNGKNRISILALQSQNMIDSLSRYGIVANRKTKFEWPKNLPSHLLRHFLRGYTDGDGCWRSSGKSKSWSVIGSLSFTSNCQNFLIDSIGISRNKLHKHQSSDLYYLTYDGARQSSMIAKFIYDDANFFMERKRVIAMSIKPVNKPYRRSINAK